MKINPNARKKRQLQHLGNALQIELAKGKLASRERIARLMQSIRQLLKALYNKLSVSDVKRALGAAAVLFGMGFHQTTQAQNFAPPVQNPFALTPAYGFAFPTAADLDNDGDLDILVGEYYGKFQYYQNLGTATAPLFAAPIPNPFGLDSVTDLAVPRFVDLDNDGDFDVMVTGYYGHYHYFENVGTPTVPNFAPAVMNPFGLTTGNDFSNAAFADLDNDGDFDVVEGQFYGNFRYMQNAGTASNPAFAGPVNNPFGLASNSYFVIPELADFDNDGDFDLIAGIEDGAIAYYQNAGTNTMPQFAGAQINPSFLDSSYYIAAPAAADLDGDGDMDLLIGEYYGNFTYYENLSIVTSVADNAPEKLTVNIYPNPAHNVLHINSDAVLQTVEVVDMTGRTLHSQASAQTVDISALAAGTYLLRATDTEGRVTVSRFLKK